MKQKKLGLPIVSLLICILLNSVVLASPLKPAILRGNIVEQSQLVLPFTRWERCTRFLVGEKVVPFADAEDGGLWAIRLAYSVRHIDLFSPAGDWQVWMVSRLTRFLNNIYTTVTEQSPAGTDRDGRLRLYVEAVSNPALVSELSGGLKAQFNEQYRGVLFMQGVILKVEKITLAEYQASQN